VQDGSSGALESGEAAAHMHADVARYADSRGHGESQGRRGSGSGNEYWVADVGSDDGEGEEGAEDNGEDEVGTVDTGPDEGGAEGAVASGMGAAAAVTEPEAIVMVSLQNLREGIRAQSLAEETLVVALRKLQDRSRALDAREREWALRVQQLEQRVADLEAASAAAEQRARVSEEAHRATLGELTRLRGRSGSPTVPNGGVVAHDAPTAPPHTAPNTTSSSSSTSIQRNSQSSSARSRTASPSVTGAAASGASGALGAVGAVGTAVGVVGAVGAAGGAMAAAGSPSSVTASPPSLPLVPCLVVDTVPSSSTHSVIGGAPPGARMGTWGLPFGSDAPAVFALDSREGVPNAVGRASLRVLLSLLSSSMADDVRQMRFPHVLERVIGLVSSAQFTIRWVRGSAGAGVVIEWTGRNSGLLERAGSDGSTLRLEKGAPPVPLQHGDVILAVEHERLRLRVVLPRLASPARSSHGVLASRHASDRSHAEPGGHSLSTVSPVLDDAGSKRPRSLRSSSTSSPGARSSSQSPPPLRARHD
jgi:hypothetical protein